MKIPNPWPHHQHIRFNVNNGECLGSCGEGPEIEVPDMAVEVLIQAASNGNSDGEVIAPACIWSKEHGMLDAKDHLKKMKIKEEEAKLKERQEIERTRKQDEARRTIAEAKAELKVKDFDVPKAARFHDVKKEKQEKIKVDRAASGMAKVTKTNK